MPENQNTEPIGLSAVFEGLPNFLKSMKDYIASVRQGATETTKSSNEINKTSKVFEAFKKTLHAVGEGAKTMATTLKTVVVGALKAVGAALAAATLGITAIIAAFFKFGSAGAEAEGIFAGFERNAHRAGLGAQEFRRNLEEAAAGTIDSTRLMQLANIALINTSQDVAEEMGKKLPALLQVARQAASETGQSVEFLFTSLVEGIRRGSALKIDNAGIVLSQTEAERRYAEQLGISADQLTSSQQQIALLNETLIQAGVNMDTLTLEMSEQELASVALARTQSMLKELMTGIGTAILPAFSEGLSIVNTGLAGMVEWVRHNSEIIGVLAMAFVNFIKFIGKPVVDAFFFVKGQLVEFIGFLHENQTAIAQGAANMFASFANAILRVANTLIFPAIQFIAQGIANLLMGSSPPPEGPLSTIDSGGANLMAAWMGGIAGVSLDPVRQVAAAVNAELGAVSRMSLEQVEGRLKQLDLAVRPFEERLKIIKDRFEAIQAPAQAALKAIDRQLEAAVQGLQENGANLEQVRMLQEQRAMIETRLDLEQQSVDNAQIQLFLAQAQQQKERTLLEIQKARLDGIKETNKAIKSQTDTKTGGTAPKEKVGSGGADVPTEEFGTGNIEFDEKSGLGGDKRADILQGSLDQFVSDFQGTFEGSFDTSQLDLAQQNLAGIGSTFADIAAADPIGRITGAFSGIQERLQTAVLDPISNVVSDIVNYFTGSGEGTLSGGLASFRADPLAAFGTIAGSVTGWVNDNFLTPFTDFVTGSGSNSLNHVVLGTGEGTLNGIFESAVSSWTEIETDVNSWIDENIALPFIDFITGHGEGSLNYMVTGTGEGTFNNAMQSFLTAANIEGLDAIIDNAIVQPFTEAVETTIAYFIGDDEGSLKTIFTNFPAQLTEWVTGGGLLETINTNIRDPFINAVGSIVGTFFGEENEESFEAQLRALSDNVTEWLVDLPSAFETAFENPIGNSIRQAISLLFGSGGEEMSFSERMSMFFTGDGEGTLRGILRAGEDAFAAFVSTGIPSALAAVGNVIWENLVLPIQNLFNAIITIIEDAVNAIINNRFVDAVVSLLPGLDGAQGEFTLPRVEVQRPSFLGGARTGGMFGSGFLKVGEGGPEIIGSAQSMGVLNNQFVNMMDGLTSMMGMSQSLFSNSLVSGGSMPLHNSSVTNNSASNVTNDNRVTVNSNGKNMNPSDIAMEIAMRRIFSSG